MRQVILDKINNSPEDQIDLQNMQLVDEEMSELMPLIIKERPGIKDLFLDHNELKDSGAEIVAQNLSKLPSLTFLTLEYNKIAQKGFTALFDAQYAKRDNQFTLALHGNLMHNVSEVNNLENQARNKHKKSSY